TPDSGYEVISAQKAKYNEWTQLTILFSDLPQDFDLTDLDKIEIKNEMGGVYYYDDIEVIRDNRVYQSFEWGIEPGGYWAWGTDSSVEFCYDSEYVFEGNVSLKLISNEINSGVGFQSEHNTKCHNGNQEWWRVDLNPQINDHLSFWVYALPYNGFDNNLAVEFFDNDNHETNCHTVWTEETVKYGKWTQIIIPFSELPSSLDLENINRLQFKMYWPGTYYIDSVKACGDVPSFNRNALKNRELNWNSVIANIQYRIEESSLSTPDSWSTCYLGNELTYPLNNIIPRNYRIRTEEVSDSTNILPFKLNWSELIVSYPKELLINKMKLVQEKILEWTEIPSADTYEVQTSYSPFNNWELFYEGMYTSIPLNHHDKPWYRIRALKNDGSEISDWCPAQSTKNDFIRACGTKLR
ncbi:hypothetical protein BVX93_00420, partial [bacterium B13(2017)]